MEDESRMIGKSVIPEKFFLTLRASPIVWLDTPLDERVENTFQEYVVRAHPSVELYARFKDSLSKIQRKLGGLRYQEILSDLEKAEAVWKENGVLNLHKVWIEKLLHYYYDPLYFGSLDRRVPNTVFKGHPRDALKFLKA